MMYSHEDRVEIRLLYMLFDHCPHYITSTCYCHLNTSPFIFTISPHHFVLLPIFNINCLYINFLTSKGILGM